MRRAQTSLQALGVALVLVAALAGLGLTMAEGAIEGAQRTPAERRAAAAIADHLVEPASPLTARANVLNRSKVRSFDAAALERAVPAAAEHDVRVSLAGEPVAATGSVGGGPTINRLVLVETPGTQTLRPPFEGATEVTLPRRTDSVTLTIDPPNGTTVSTVTSNARVLLHSDTGLDGRFTVDTVPYETTTLRFRYAGTLSAGDITIRYRAPQTTKARLTVTADA